MQGWTRDVFWWAHLSLFQLDQAENDSKLGWYGEWWEWKKCWEEEYAVFNVDQLGNIITSYELAGRDNFDFHFSNYQKLLK